MPLVRIPTGRISDWSSFHDVFAEVLGFPGYYGRNMEAWVDCLTYVDDPSAGMVAPELTVVGGDVLTLQLEDVDSFAARCPEQLEAVVECASFVNWRRIKAGERAIVALSYFRHRAT